jgi:aerobic-type carbon monoxide dehydrogenase small subunit (CoxS/CutS family)
MTTVAFTINGKRASVEADAETPLLWIVREHLKLTGTKFGCGAKALNINDKYEPIGTDSGCTGRLASV